MNINKSLITITLAGLLAITTNFDANSEQQESDSSNQTDVKTNTVQKAEENTEKDADKTTTDNDAPDNNASNDNAGDDNQTIADKNAGAPDDAKTKKNDTFIPSEAISEDLAVSFPIDI